MSQEIAVRKFSPATLPDRIAFAEALAVSDLLPKAYRGRPANVLLAMEYADSLGIPVAQAFAAINVIEGKPSASAALISALVRRAGHKLRVAGDDEHAVATIVRHDDPGYEFKSEWTVARAVRAKLCTIKDGKPYSRSLQGNALPWETYTASLLKARAISEVARDACQEALLGIQYTAEELGAVVDESGAPVGGPVMGPTAEQHTDEGIVDAEVLPNVMIDEAWYSAMEEVIAVGDMETLKVMGEQARAAGNINAIASFRVGWKVAKANWEAIQRARAQAAMEETPTLDVTPVETDEELAAQLAQEAAIAEEAP